MFFFEIFTLTFSLWSSQEVFAQDLPLRVRCLKDSIYIELTEEYLLRRNIEISRPQDLHFGGFKECHADVEQNGFSLTLFAPYNDCGTAAQSSSDSYTFSNKVVYQTSSTTTSLMSFECIYDKQYIVSSDIALKPKIKTLNFVTSRGEFQVDMGLYQRPDFSKKSMFGENPSILIGTTVYAAVDVTNVFGRSEVVSTIENCYATDDSDHSIQNLYHSLIINRCANPDDDTVRILSNGESMSSRFQFAMFEWKANIEYFYLHCEVRVCNTSVGKCSGVGEACAGAPENEEDLTAKRKRDVGSGNEEIKIFTWGPVMISEKDTDEVGVGSYNENSGVQIKDQKFLEIYIYVAVASAVVIAGIIIVAVFLTKKSEDQVKEGPVK